jgi:hypothetical protein
MGVPRRGRDVGVPGEELDGRGRSTAPEQGCDEEVPEVVEPPAREPDLLLRPLEGQEEAELAPLLAVGVLRGQVASLGPRRLERCCRS